MITSNKHPRSPTTTGESPPSKKQPEVFDTSMNDDDKEEEVENSETQFSSAMDRAQTVSGRGIILRAKSTTK